jgi:hypothetical protein
MVCQPVRSGRRLLTLLLVLAVGACSRGCHTEGHATASGGAAGRIDGSGGGSASGAGGQPTGGRAGASSATGGTSTGSGGSAGATARKLPYVFVVAMENQDARDVFGNTTDAPYLANQVTPACAIADAFVDQLPLNIPSEPHYVWMEAGTNAFPDHTFTGDAAPSAANSTLDTDHLATQIRAAGGGLDWLSYQEGMDATSGACPIAPSGFYTPRHDPFLFFQDVAGSPPSKTNAYCAAHHKPLSALAGDLAAATVAAYNFVTPDQCHNMHGQAGCPDSNAIRAGDQWLEQNLPPLIQFVQAHGGVVFVVWDEGRATAEMPFFACGPTVEANSVSHVEYTHSSLLESVERMLGLPVLARVAAANDFSDLFTPGAFP